MRTSSALPPYRAVLAVDAEKYTANTAFHQQILSATIPTVLEDAFTRSGLQDVWAERRFPQRSGDGYVVGFKPENLPFLVHPLLGHLQETLEDAQPNLASHQRDLRLRLRVSIDVGPLPDSQDGQDPIDGIGRAMNDTHRLLDADPIRDELRRSDRDVTLLVAIISTRVFEEAVLGGFVGLKPRRFRPVEVRIGAKDFRQDGYLHVPVPSRSADEEDRAPEADPGPSAAAEAGTAAGHGAAPTDAGAGSRTSATAEPSARNRMRDNNGQMVQGGTIQGGMHGRFQR
jgi:hypothetical protein